MTESWIFESLGKKVGLFGLGMSNLDILSRLPEKTEVILRTEGKLSLIPSCRAKIIGIYEGDAAFNAPEEDSLILSPSVRRDRKEFLPFKRLGVRFCSDCEIFFEKVRAPVFAVSGSDGKSTTVTLASLLLKEKFGFCPAVGNIGVPMAGSLSENNLAYAAELSSFMLNFTKARLDRGAITNITENHLDWHKDISEYISAKLSLLKNAREPVCSFDDPLCRKFALENSVYGVFSTKYGCEELKRACRAQVFYTLEDSAIKRCGEKMIGLSDIKKRDENSLKNLLCALALTDGYVSRKGILEVAKEFSGLAHRGELFYSKNGIDFIDSSIDTTPSRTVSTLNSLKRRAVLILGGRGKGLSYEPLAKAVEKYAEAVIICGENSSEIASALSGFKNFFLADDLYSAAELSESLLADGGCLLLSPASTSFDKFSSYKERGEKFKEVVKKRFG